MTMICAHRGASREYPENTHLAFEQALQAGAHMLEFDVRRTCDGRCVIMHDSTVDRTTSGSGAVAELTWQQIRSLDAGQGQRVPDLDEMFAYADRAMLNVQIKTPREDDGVNIAMILADYFRDPLIRRRAFVVAGDLPFMSKLRELVPDVRLCNTQLRHDPLAAATVEPVSQVIQPRADTVDREMVAQAHRCGLKVNVFYADDADTANRLIDMQVDGILTNDPALLKRVLEDRGLYISP